MLQTVPHTPHPSNGFIDPSTQSVIKRLNLDTCSHSLSWSNSYHHPGNGFIHLIRQAEMPKRKEKSIYGEFGTDLKSTQENYIHSPSN